MAAKNLDQRLGRMAQILHILVSQLELGRGYGGDLPPSPYTAILDELEGWMTEYGVEHPPKPGHRPKVHELTYPDV